MGNEEETGMLVTGDYLGEMVEPVYMAAHLSDFIPPDLLFAGDNRHFLTNGSLVYMGGASDPENNNFVATNIERATPECSSPQDVSTYIGAHEKLIVEMSKLYAERQANSRNDAVEVRLQRRSVDAFGNRKGCHDSYGYSEDHNVAFPFENPRVLQSFLGFVATRSFMTGAGFVNGHGALRFSQKNDGLAAEKGYGYIGTMFRIAEPEKLHKTSRIEVRSNDVNISPWATQMRVGGVALLLALGQTELADELPIFPGGTNHAKHAKPFNGVSFDPEGQLIKTKDHVTAVDFQQKVAELAQDRLQAFVDVPNHYYRIAREIYDYCEDFRSVLSGEKSFEVLADRSDAMAKFRYIARRVERDREAGQTRRMTDMKARMHDMLYDFIDVHAMPSMPAKADYGYGYRLRERGVFRLSPDKLAVDRAYYHPPNDTRAIVRATAIREYDMSRRGVVMDWHSVSVDNVDSPQSSLLGHVAANTMLLSTRKFLDVNFQRRKLM